MMAGRSIRQAANVCPMLAGLKGSRMRWLFPRRRIVEALATAIVVVGVCATSFAITYYVSPTGSASNPGTPAEPWSLAKANSDLMPGDTAILLDGGYTTSIRPARDGTAGAPITYVAQNNQQTTFDGMNPAILLSGRSYIIVDGVKVTNAGRFIRAENDFDHLTIRNCHFENSSSWESSRFRVSGDGLHIANNTFINGNDLVSISGGNYHLVEDNYFERDTHTQLQLMGVQRSVVRRNYFTNDLHRGMGMASTRNPVYPDPQRKTDHVLIEWNVYDRIDGDGRWTSIQFTAVNCIVRRNIMARVGTGLSVSCYYESTGTAPEEGLYNLHNRIYNNVIYDCGEPADVNHSGTGLWLGGGTEYWDDPKIINNIIYKNRAFPDAPAYWTNGNCEPTTQVLFFKHGKPSKARLFYNNIIHEVPGESVIWEDGREGKPKAGYTVSAFEATYPLYAANNVEADPLFVDAAGGDFHVAPGSPMIDAGGPLTVTSGVGAGTIVPVDDALFFCDGFGVIPGDVIRVGGQRVSVLSVDYDNNLLTVDRTISWSAGDPVSTDYTGTAPDIGVYEYQAGPATVVARHVSCNNSAFDGNDPAANAADDDAIAPDKTALQPGQAATFANYTSYSRGINGLIVDIADPPGTPTASDFQFHVGNDNNPAGWPAAPAPLSVTVRPGEGTGGADRVTILWPDGAIQKQWLQVTVKATANTGLVADDVFYFGNAIGETGNSGTDAEVTPTDNINVRNNPHTLAVNPAAIDDVCDFNRDKKVGPTDSIICRNNGTSSQTALQLITVP